MMTMNSWQEMAKETAEKSKERQKHGCVIVSGDYQHKLSKAVNVNLDNDFVRQYDPHKTLHAEAVAIMRLRGYRNLIGAELFVCRVNHAGGLAMSKPCCMCEKIIRSFGIKRVHYTTEAGKWTSKDY